jgi:hypothetical protein
LIGEPNSVWVCHCPNCQRATGSIGIITVAVLDEVFDHATASTPNPFMNLPQDQLDEISRAMEAALGGEDGSITPGEGV